MFFVLINMLVYGYFVFVGPVIRKLNIAKTVREIMDYSNTQSDEREMFKTRSVLHNVWRQGQIKLSSINSPIDFIPEPWEINNPDRTPYIHRNVMKPYRELPEMEHSNTIAILSIIRNSAGVLKQYGLQLSKLLYPHKHLSLFFGESGSTDNTIKEATRVAQRLKYQHGFKDASVLLLNLSGGIHGSGQKRHRKEFQLTRRSHLALARNTLLNTVMKHKDYDYILWIDSDMEELPEDLIEQLLYAKSDVVTTPCFIREPNFKLKYDKNSWQETEESLKMQQLLQADELIVEGYNKTGRVYLPQLMALGRVVPLDGVGGCVLMIRAECVRKGLKFPEVVYKHHIETEGLAKLARDMNYTVVGLPFIDAFHTHSNA